MWLKGFSMLVGAAGALCVIGCSDPVPPPPKGGMFISINAAPVAVTPAGRKCNIQFHDAAIGSPPPSAAAPGGRVTDGEGGARVSCRVSKSGDVFKITASAAHKKISFSVNGEIAPKGKGTASIIESDPVSLVALRNPTDTPCVLSVESEPLEVAAGRIWAHFACPAFVDATQPDGPLFCEAESGWFVFENCDE